MMRTLLHIKRGLPALAAVAMILVQSGSPARASGNWKDKTLDAIKEELKDKLQKPDGWNELLKKVKEGAEAGEKWHKLAEDDNQYEPDYDPGGMPELPAACKDSEQCEECFAKPYKDLESLRFRFEKLRKINRVTKNMLRDSIAFGNAASEAAGGLVPLAWAREREKVRESEKHFNESYDAKYEELMTTLKATLQAIAACEEKVFGEQGWYERYGFMYYQFMAGMYRRPD